MFLFEATSNMEIKVGIRVKVLVSPLPLGRFIAPRRTLPSLSPSFFSFFPSLPFFLFPTALLQPLATFLFFSRSLGPFRSLFLSHFGFYFGSAGTDTAAGDHLDNLLSSFSSSSFSSSSSPSSSAPTAVPILFFFPPGKQPSFGRTVPHQDVIFSTS